MQKYLFIVITIKIIIIPRVTQTRSLQSQDKKYQRSNIVYTEDVHFYFVI